MSRVKRQRLSEDGHEKVTASAGNDGTDRDAQEAISRDSPHSREEKPRNGRSLFVRSLPPTATTEDLTNFFSQSYPLKHATVVLDPATKVSKGYGFVTFADAEDAQNALGAFHGTLFDGHKIKVEFAESRHRQENGEEVAKEKSVRTGSKQDNKSRGQPPPKLIVRNLPWTIKTEEQLAALFRSYGKVKHTNIPKKGPGLSAGFGFVVLRGRKNAEKALEGVNGKEIDGRTLAVDWAVEKEVWEGLQHSNKGEDEDMNHAPEATSDNGREESVKSETEDQLRVEDIPPSDAELGLESESESEQDSSDEIDQDSISQESKPARTEHSIFIRNLPFTATDDSLQDHFSSFGPVRFARVVIDQATERSKGTAFVCFFKEEDLISCLREAQGLQPLLGKSHKSAGSTKQSLLEDTTIDPSGRFTMDGRVLQVSQAVHRNEAARLSFANSNLRDDRDKDRRRLYLLSEGTVSAGSPLYDKLSPSEIKMRQDSAKQRQTLIRNNPTLHLSLTRLSVRNLPRSITSKDLKALAREAVVGFAGDVKAGTRKQLSKEEVSRGSAEMKEAEKARKAKGKGIVRQAKIVFEGREGGKVTEESGAGRSRGYGFIEYSSHRWALMGLRWLNGHAVGSSKDQSDANGSTQDTKEAKKRILTEFAIENAQVVLRRREREAKARERSKMVTEKIQAGELPEKKKAKALSRDQLMAKTRKGMKRKRSDDPKKDEKFTQVVSHEGTNETEKLAKRQQIIGRKRMIRKSRSRAKGS